MNMVFQIYDHPIEPDEFLREDMLYDEFVGPVASHVFDDVYIDEVINALIEQLEPFGIVYSEKERSLVFKEGFKKRYFKNKFERLKVTVAEMTLDDFVNANMAYRLSQIVEEKFDVYITQNTSIEGNAYYCTLDNFIREMTEGTVYYFGVVIGYDL